MEKILNADERKYKLCCAVRFIMDRLALMNSAISFGKTSESELIKECYSKILLEIKELLKLDDTLDILDFDWFSVTVPKKYLETIKELLPNNTIYEGYDKIIILIK